MGSNRISALYATVAVTLAALLVVCLALCTKEPAAARDRPEMTDFSAMRIFPQHTERLAVFRVVYDGEALIRRNAGGGEHGGPALRVDFRVDGRHVTVWMRDR